MISCGVFKQARSFTDYFAEDFTFPERFLMPPAVWGKLAERLELTEVTAELFEALAANKGPDGQRLTRRTNAFRRAKSHGSGRIANRIVAHDLTFSPPKIVSLLGLLLQLQAVRALHDQAVATALSELERQIDSRLRRQRANEVAATWNALVALFLHHCSRKFDPQTHTHALFLNATWVAETGVVQAVHHQRLITSIPLANQIYLAEFKSGLRGLGYVVQPSGSAFTLARAEAELIEMFSQTSVALRAHVRTREEEEEEIFGPAKVKLIALGLREKKPETLPLRILLPGWEMRAGKHLRPLWFLAEEAERRAHEIDRRESSALAAARNLMDRVEENCLALHSARSEAQMLAGTLAASTGECSWRHVRQVWEEALEAKRIFRLRSGGYTTPAVVRSDRRLALFIDGTRGRARPLAREVVAPARTDRTVQRITTVRNLVCLVKEISLCRPVKPIGPRLAQTLGVVLWRTWEQTLELGGSVRDQVEGACAARAVVIVEDAQRLSRDRMEILFEIAHRDQKQVVLVGDARAADSLLWVLRRESKLALFSADHLSPAALLRAEVRASRAELEQALHAGDGVEAMPLLAKLGDFLERTAEECRAQIAHDYVAASERRRLVLAVAAAQALPKLNHAIRAALLDQGQLRPAGTATRLVLQETIGLASILRYQTGDLLLIPQAGAGLARGSARVVKVDDWTEKVTIKQGENAPAMLDLALAANWPLYRPEALPIAAGEKLVITKFFRFGQQRFRPDEIITVDRMAQGRICLRDGRELSPDQGFISYGYAIDLRRIAQTRRPQELLVLLPPEPLPWTELTALLRLAKRRRLYALNDEQMRAALEGKHRRDRDRDGLHQAALRRLKEELSPRADRSAKEASGSAILLQTNAATGPARSKWSPSEKTPPPAAEPAPSSAEVVAAPEDKGAPSSALSREPFENAGSEAAASRRPQKKADCEGPPL